MRICATLGVIVALLAVSAGGRQEAAPEAAAFTMEDLLRQQADSGRRYLPFLRVPELHAGVYVLEAGADDTQQPHGDDEVYYVVRGHGVLQAGDQKFAAEPGAVLYVRAGVSHRFHSISEELELLVFFAAK